MEPTVRFVVGGWSGTLMMPSAGLAVGLSPHDAQFQAYELPAGDLLVSPDTARAVARRLLDSAHERDEGGLSGADVEKCVALVRGLLDRWGAHFENKANGAGELVDWICEGFLPQARAVSWPGD